MRSTISLLITSLRGATLRNLALLTALPRNIRSIYLRILYLKRLYYLLLGRCSLLRLRHRRLRRRRIILATAECLLPAGRILVAEATAVALLGHLALAFLEGGLGAEELGSEGHRVEGEGRCG